MIVFLPMQRILIAGLLQHTCCCLLGSSDGSIPDTLQTLIGRR